MKPPNFKFAQTQVKKIMRQMGKEPATFNNAASKDTPKRALTCEQLLILVFLIIVLLLIWFTVVSIGLDMLQRGLL